MAAEHNHYQCENCESVFCAEDPRYRKMQNGDSCPKCHVATVALLETMSDVTSSVPPEFRAVVNAVLAKFDRQNKEMLEMRERQVKALERIADHLDMAGEWVAAITGVDDKGQKTIRVTGEFVGGDGDVTAGL